MPATKTKAPSPKTAAAARARAEADGRQLDRVVKALEAAQTDLASIRGSVGSGVGDLRRDATKLVRDARRDVLKMRRAVQRDLGRLQKDLEAAAKGKPPARPRRTATRGA